MRSSDNKKRGTTETSEQRNAGRTRQAWKAFLPILVVLVAAFAFAGGAGAMVNEATNLPWIASDQIDYAPGSTVHLAGGNWQPGEAVQIDTNDTVGNTWSQTDHVTADASGNIADVVVLPNYFISDYTVKAVAASGTATTSFTDSINTDLSGAFANSSITLGASATVSGRLTEHNGGAGVGGKMVTLSSYTNASCSLGATSVGSALTSAGGTVGNYSITFTPGSTTTLWYEADWAGETGSTGFGHASSLCLALTVNAAVAVNTTTAAVGASATFGDTAVFLSATVSPASGPAVNTGSVTFTIKSGTATIGSPVVASVVSGSANGSFTIPSGTNAGSYTIQAAYSDGSSFNASSDSTHSLTINNASQTITFAPLSGKTYGDVPVTVSATGGGSNNPVTFSASGNCTSGGTNGSTITITGAGSCTVTADQAFSGNYNAAASVQQSFTIAKADATIHVTPYSVTFDGNAHTASGTATGVGGADLSSLLTLSGTTHTNAGTYATDAWNFAGGINYNDASGTVSDHIAKADATIVVTPYSVTFDGSSHTASGTAAGVNSEVLTGLDLSGTTHTNAGTYAADTWTFSNDNYNSDGATVTDHIAKADATIHVTPYSVTFDGNAHTASGTATGVGGADLSSLLTLSGTTHTNAGTYATDAWNFAGGINYNDASGTVSDHIGKATATIVVTPYNVTFDGSSHTATGTATGVGGADLSSLLDLSGTTHTNPGTYATDAWSFAGNGNYNSAGGTITDKIQYRWDGFLQPINDTAHQVGVTTSSVFKGGSTVPVKFQLKKADGTVVLWNGTSAVPVWQTPLQGSAMSAPPNETVYGDSATTGGAFRWDSTGQQWIYNWSTKGFKTGYWWKVCATFDDGQTQCVNIGLS